MSLCSRRGCSIVLQLCAISAAMHGCCCSTSITVQGEDKIESSSSSSSSSSIVPVYGSTTTTSDNDDAMPIADGSILSPLSSSSWWSPSGIVDGRGTKKGSKAKAKQSKSSKSHGKTKSAKNEPSTKTSVDGYYVWNGSGWNPPPVGYYVEPDDEGDRGQSWNDHRGWNREAPTSFVPRAPTAEYEDTMTDVVVTPTFPPYHADVTSTFPPSTNLPSSKPAIVPAPHRAEGAIYIPIRPPMPTYRPSSSTYMPTSWFPTYNPIGNERYHHRPIEEEEEPAVVIDPQGRAGNEKNAELPSTNKLPATVDPSANPTSGPSDGPTDVPTGRPTDGPTADPTVGPTTSTPTTEMPTTYEPTTYAPITAMPTTYMPTTYMPTTYPPTTYGPTSSEPSSHPSTVPSTRQPSYAPTHMPTTNEPTLLPTLVPTSDAPITPAPTTYAPTFSPTFSPTFTPTYTPSFAPTTYDPTTYAPTTYAPTTEMPSRAPSHAPSVGMQALDTLWSTYRPSMRPSRSSSRVPSHEPSFVWPRRNGVLYPPMLEGGGNMVRDDRMQRGSNEGGFFGASVAVDDRTLVVGIQGDDSTHGSAMVYRHSSQAGTFLPEARLVPNDGRLGDDFGRSVALFGEYVLVGAQRHGGDSDTAADVGSGAAYIFQRTVDDADGGKAEWIQMAKLVPQGGTGEDERFGISVAIHDRVAIVGANGDDANGENSGAAYIFTLQKKETSTLSTTSSGGGHRTGQMMVWAYSQKLMASDGRPGDNFGFSVSIHENKAVVGSVWDDDRSGSAYVYRLLGDVWMEEGKFTAEEHGGDSRDDQFGWSVSVFGDTVAVGAFADDNGSDGVDSGAVYVFKDTRGEWHFQARISPSKGGGTNDHFGRSVALFEDRMVVSAPFDDDAGFEAGAVYMYRRDGDDNWVLQAKQVPSVEPLDFAEFGYSVGASRDFFVVGSKFSSASNTFGDCHVYETVE